MIYKFKPEHLAAAFLCVSIFFTGCTKDRLTAEEITVVSEDDAEADVAYNEAYEQTLGVDSSISMASDDMGAPAGTPPPPPGQRCYTLTFDTAAFPKKITIDFGTVGCVGKDGKTRKGKINISFSDYLRNYNATATTTFDGYSVKGAGTDDLEVSVGGTIITTNKTTNPATRVFNRQVINGSLSKPNGNYIHWSNNHTITRISGQETPWNFWDDAWTVSGTGAGETKRGDKIYVWSRTILTDLEKKFSCRWVDQGTVQLIVNDKTLITDFGNGTCDNKATVTVNGKTYTITLR